MYCYQHMQAFDDPVENMYPKIYYKLYPAVVRRADRFFYEHGMYFNPSRDYIKGIVGEIVDDMEIEFDENDLEIEFSRQFGVRNLLTVLATILLIRELRDRRRPFFGHRQGYYGYY